MPENYDIRFIKPCRFPREDHLQLTVEYAQAVARDNRIVQINLDNCSIQRMEKLPRNPTLEDAKEVGLLPLVHILQNSPVCLTAIGINEMPDDKVTRAKLAYENFCANFWPSHKNDIEATHRTLVKTDSLSSLMNFNELEDGARCTYGCGYVSLLQLQNINRNYPDLPKEERFEVYMHSMIQMLDVISAFELELAKYAFWDLSSNEINTLPESARVRRKDIKDNFTQLQPTHKKCKIFAFNGAMDLHWLSGSNHAEDLKLTLKINSSDIRVDSWVGTNDIKLYRISQDIHSVYSEGSTMKWLATTREEELRQSKYWQHVDAFSNTILKQRKHSKPEGVSNLLERIDKAVAYLDKELAMYFSQKT